MQPSLYHLKLTSATLITKGLYKQSSLFITVIPFVAYIDYNPVLSSFGCK